MNIKEIDTKTAYVDLLCNYNKEECINMYTNLNEDLFYDICNHLFDLEEFIIEPEPVLRDEFFYYFNNIVEELDIELIPDLDYVYENYLDNYAVNLPKFDFSK